MTLVIAVANEKGGVAKTTTALSLGASLAEGGQRVLLMDLDPQANLSLSLGVHIDSLEASLADLLLGESGLETVRVATPVPHLDLAPANSELLMAEQYLTLREDHEWRLRQALEGTNTYDTVLMDCPPALGPLTQCALSAAALLIIPTQCEYYSAYALRQMLHLVQDIRGRTNPELRYRLLLTMVDRRNRIHRRLDEQIRRAFGDAVFETTIETDTRLRESPVFGQPVTVYAPRSRGAEQYRALAQELRQHAQRFLRTA